MQDETTLKDPKDTVEEKSADIGVGSGKSVAGPGVPDQIIPTGYKGYVNTNVRESEDVGYSVDPIQYRKEMGAGYLVDPETGKEIPPESKVYADRYPGKEPIPVYPDEQNGEILRESKPVVVDMTQEELQDFQERAIRQSQREDASEAANAEQPELTPQDLEASQNALIYQRQLERQNIATANRPVELEHEHTEKEADPIDDRAARPVPKSPEAKIIVPETTSRKVGKKK